MGQGKGFRLGWVLVSYLMILGGFMVIFALFGLLELKGSSEIMGWIIFVLGGAFGGFFAGRASEGKTILEPAVGGGLVVVSVILIVQAIPGVRTLMSLADTEKVVLHAIGIGVAIGGGGLVGATLGEKSAPDPRPVDRIRWMGVSTLITLGVFFFIFMIMGVLMLRHAAEGGKLSDDDGGVIALVALAGAAFFGGFITQAIAPERMNWACGAGFFITMLAMVGLASAQGGAAGDAIGGFIIVGGIGTCVGALGALVGWSTIGKKAVAQSQQSAAPAAFE